jgi:dienelactone hydrolase
MRSLFRAVGAGATLAVVASTLLIVAAAAPAAATACDASGQAVWGAMDCEIREQTATTVVEDVSYPSPTPGEPKVTGHVCRPKGSGSFPILVINHSGLGQAFGGTDYWIEALCKDLATDHVVIASDYRPFEDGDGTDVYCKGEVDDVLEMLDLAKAYPNADGDRVQMRGWSHGACITLEAYQRGVPGLVAAAALAPPVDLAAVWQRRQIQINLLLCNTWWHCPAATPC